MSSKKEKLKNLKKQTKSNNHSKKKKNALKKPLNLKKTQSKRMKLGDLVFFKVIK